MVWPVRSPAAWPSLVVLPVPTVCVLLGQGTGGGALALMPSPTASCAPSTRGSRRCHPRAPRRSCTATPDRASSLRDAATGALIDLLEAGIVDRIVAEHPDAAQEPEAYCRRMAQAIRHELGDLVVLPPETRLQARHARWRAL